MRYPETVDLPFNSSALQGEFRPRFPGEPAPEGAGWWLLLQGSNLLVSVETGRPELPYGDLPDELAAVKFSCIGSWRGEPLRLGSVGRSSPLPAHYAAEPFNASGDVLDDALLTLGGIGMQIRHWHKQSRYCNRCGAILEPMVGNRGKRCPACFYEHFPAIHPCAIVLVQRGDEFLLVRKKEWTPGRYGLVAGFLDLGESLEECAAREVLEETGITVRNVRYVGSQCWPFPSQLMAGFVADYASGEIRVEEAELEDVRWFHRRALPEGLPPARSIARWIIDRYLLAGDL